MLTKLQQINSQISQARNYGYVCKYQLSQKMYKKILETIRQQMILNNTSRKEIQVWKVLEKSVIDQKMMVQELIVMVNGFGPCGKMADHAPRQRDFVKMHNYVLETPKRNVSSAKQSRQPVSASKPINRFLKDLQACEQPSQKNVPRTVKRVGKNISQAPPPYPGKSKTLQNNNGGRRRNANNNQKKSFLNHTYPDGSAPDKHLIQMLEREVMDRSPKVSFDDIADLQTAKGLLQEAVLLPLKMPQYFTGIRRAWKGVLMFGPPGTGKTLLAKAVASSGGTTFFNVSASSLASKWKGQSQKLVRILFQMAKFYAPSVIFFDEIDALGSKRKDGQDQSNRKVKTQLLVQMDGATSSQNNQNKFVIVLAATNRPWDLDQALRRRLEKRIYIPLPTAQGRKQLVRINLKNINMDEGVDLNFVVQKTEGYSGADITNVCRQAAYMPMRRKLKQAGGIKNISNIKKFQQQVNVPLTREDFLEALKNVNKSVGRQDIRRYEHWMSQFGTV